MTRPKADKVGVLALCTLIVVAFVFGGGGISSGLANLAVQLTALVILALRFRAVNQFWRDSPLLLRALIGLSVLLPLAQIIPLPEHLWMQLAGHDLVARSLEAAGRGGWMTWSVYPQRTALALTALITPIAVVLAGWTIPRHQLLLAGWLVVGLGVATVLMGFGQLGPNGDAFTLYPQFEAGSVLVGTFGNRNSAALWLGFCVALACLLPSPKPHRAFPWVRSALTALLLVGIILTKSRTGLVLVAIPLGLAGLKGCASLLERRAAEPGARRGPHPIMVVLGIFALGTIALGGLVMTAPGRIGATIERFQAKDDPRRFIWEDAVFVAERFSPTGAGIGTFDDVFQVDESLENVSLRRSGRAHNDYIELAIEAGLPGLAMAAFWLVGCSVMAWQARRSQLAWSGWAGGAFLLAIALQSITDYPLRTQTILAFAGFALLLLARAAANRKEQRS